MTAKILTLDIETSPNDVYAWHLFGDYISLDQLKDPTKMLCWAAKFSDERETHCRTYRCPDFHESLWDLIDRADIVITYNGDSFDMKHIMREFAEHGLTPPSPYSSVDLFKVVKRSFKFPSNKLDYVAGALLGIHKLDTGGFSLWTRFMEGDVAAVKKMKRYNIRDVSVTTKLYKFLRPWIKNHPYVGGINVIIEDDDVKYECPVCASKRTGRKRPRRTRCFAIRQVLCLSCGHWFDGKRKKLT